MKKNILFFTLGASLSFIVAFTTYNRNKQAEVNEYEGKLIFSDCEPTNQRYTIVDTEKTSAIYNVSYFYQKKRIVSNALKNGKDFDAIIFKDDDNKNLKGILIKFR
ncbi:hypothetical protein [Flavobacterium cerinum]|uniref:Uncharacterized protein n=1 Tax=Flavobacterium cerinum TaxID=2502784 RepID=A0ABY5ISB7_9FLAO|nr:hypothetical protein [Flavobacterium cerinum]UUC45191.1 hypothetical protein NOX80_16390 [Flavobacterium cerinum]